MRQAIVVVVMGVTGSGKSTLGRMLADELAASFVEGDDYHPAANIEKMSAGIALEDDDRWPWLDALALAMAGHAQRGEPVVVACSALKRRYRERLRASVAQTRFLLLDAERGELARRLSARHEHFMSPALLDSQLDALEMPAPEERVSVLDASQPAPRLLACALAAVSWQGVSPE